jgi:hypothetical protein
VASIGAGFGRNHRARPKPFKRNRVALGRRNTRSRTDTHNYLATLHKICTNPHRFSEVMVLITLCVIGKCVRACLHHRRILVNDKLTIFIFILTFYCRLFFIFISLRRVQAYRRTIIPLMEIWGDLEESGGIWVDLAVKYKCTALSESNIHIHTYIDTYKVHMYNAQIHTTRTRTYNAHIHTQRRYAYNIHIHTDIQRTHTYNVDTYIQRRHVQTNTHIRW